MTHVPVPAEAPGIIGLLIANPETAKYLNGLAETLLRRETPTFSKAERETLASYVSYLNGCIFCSESHAVVADEHWGTPRAKAVWESPQDAPISDLFRALINIAEKVQRDARMVGQSDVQKAKDLGATDSDIHDTVLIAAAFCMYNRYVDGLQTQQPRPGDSFYKATGEMLAERGYLNAV